MPNARYPFFSAYLKGEEARLITSDHIDRLSKVSSTQDVLDTIKETDIGSYLDGVPVETFDDLDKHLWMYLGGCLERIEWFKPVPDDILRISKAYIAKYDILNIKAALQGILSGEPTRRIPIGTIHSSGLLDVLFSAETVEGIIEVLTRCRLENYASALEGYQIDGEEESRLLAEAKLDEEYYKNLLDMTKDITDGAILAKVFGTTIDMKNLQVMLRAIIGGTGVEAATYIINGGYMLSSDAIKELLPLKLSDIPGRVEYLYQDMSGEVVSSYDRTKSIGVVGETIEKHKFKLSQEVLSPRVLSPLMIAWYLILKEVEVRNLRLILKATFDNIPVEEIKDYLVMPS
ncbi:V-type ATPase subunit [Chloroflexota bacterium]